jgi:hypothetical protein
VFQSVYECDECVLACFRLFSSLYECVFECFPVFTSVSSVFEFVQVVSSVIEFVQVF